MKTTQIFMVANAGSRKEGNIYDVSDEEKAELLEAGKATLLNLPSLSALEREVENKVGTADHEVNELEASERYADNEAERSHLIGEIESALDDDIQKVRDKFEIEAEVLKRTIAQDIFNVNYGNEEERAAADDLIRTIKTQLQASSNKMDVLELLAERVKSMKEHEQAALASELGEIGRVATGGERKSEDIQRIIIEIRANIKIKSVKDALIQKRQLDAYLKTRGDIGYHHRMRKLVKQQVRGGVSVE